MTDVPTAPIFLWAGQMSLTSGTFRFIRLGARVTAARMNKVEQV